ncbi:MAG: hypothetical protein QNM02_11940 [Acidimicrobiia bacterium]|nr:hypothetical protein [Acidimicrobiia bacterium]
MIIGDGFAAQMLVVARWNAAVTKLEKMVLFELDDNETATAELDAMYAEIEPVTESERTTRRAP